MMDWVWNMVIFGLLVDIKLPLLNTRTGLVRRVFFSLEGCDHLLEMGLVAFFVRLVMEPHRDQIFIITTLFCAFERVV
jgi:hypothetical protein